MLKKTRFVTPWMLMALVTLLLVQTGMSRGSVRTFDPPVEVPAFKLPALDGKTYALSDFKGRPLVVSVWASWCMPCREELPEFARAREVLAETHPDVVFSTINLAESGARARSWMEQVGLELPVMLAPMQFMDAYGLMVVPSILVFDRDGRVTVLHSGWVQGTDLVVELTRDLAPLRAKPDR